jgi:hypothetical protein
MEDSALIEEEILVLSQSQPSFEQMNILFSRQESKFEEIKIQLFNESSTIHEELKEIKELKSKKSNIDSKLNKIKNSIITEVRFVENKITALQTKTELTPGEMKKSLKDMQLSIINKIEDVEPFKIIASDAATGIINEFREYTENNIVTKIEDREPIRIIVSERKAELINEIEEYMQENVVTRIEDREPFRLLINDNATRMVNEFKEYIQSLEINTNFELIETIIQESFKDSFNRLMERNIQEDNNFDLIQTELKVLPNFKNMEDFFSIMVKTDEVKKEFDFQRNFTDNFHDDNNFQFDLISSLITNGFNDVSSTNKVMYERNYNLNLGLIEAIRQISANLQDGFRSLQIPANVITDSLLTRVEGQYQIYLKRMTIQMATESNDICKALLRDTEDTLNNMWKVAANFDTAADRINNAKNIVVVRLAQDITSASQDNDNHVNEVMDQVTDKIVSKINEEPSI